MTRIKKGDKVNWQNHNGMDEEKGVGVYIGRHWGEGHFVIRKDKGWIWDEETADCHSYIKLKVGTKHCWWAEEVKMITSPKKHKETRKTYRIVRFYKNRICIDTIKRGLTLKEAKEYCHREDTHGKGWFDAYTDDYKKIEEVYIK